MTQATGPDGPTSSFSEELAGGTDRRTEGDSAGCHYYTPSGRCGEAGAIHTISGVRLELCEDHLAATLEQNGLAGGAA